MTNVTQVKDEQRTKSQSISYEKTLCICQKIGGKLHKVDTNETGQKMLEVFQKLLDKRIYQRLNSTACPEAAIVNDFLYHNLWWARIKS